MSTSSNSRILAVLSHVSFFFLPFILPIIMLLVKNDDSFVRHHAKQALLFHAVFTAAMAVSGFLTVILIGFLLIPIVGISGLVVTIIAIIRSLDDQYYRYPVSGRWID